MLFSYPGGFEPGGFGVVEINTGEFTPILSYGNNSPHGCNWVNRELIIACIVEYPESKLILLDVSGNTIKEFPLPAGISLPFIGPWSDDGSKLIINYYSGTISESNLQAMTSIFYLQTGDFQDIGTGFASDWSSDEQWILTWNRIWQGSNNDLLPMTIVNVSSGETFLLDEGENAVWQP